MVLYNKRIEDLQTLPALSSSEVVGNIILCDNSEISLHNEDALFDLGPKVCYLPMGGNLGIARAYNKAIKYVQSEYVCLFDDDTVFPSDYFEEVAKEIAKTKAHVLLPLVFAKSHLLSPCKKEKTGSGD